MSEAFSRRCSVEKVFLENTRTTRVSFLIKLQAQGPQLYLKEILGQVFSCEFCEIPKSTAPFL